MTSKLTVLTIIVLLAVFAVTSATAQDAATTFKAKCAMCHGADGSGKTTMGEKLSIHDLHSPDVQKQTDAQLTEIISKGKNKMPAYDGKLTKEQIGQLVAFIRGLAKK